MRMECSDETLAMAAANGDGEAFGTLLERRYDQLFALAFRLTGSRAEAEDLTQDVCASLPARLRGFRADSRFSTWVYRVVVNAAHDQRRRNAAHKRAASGWGDWEINQRAAQSEARNRLDWLVTAMRALPAELRDTLALVVDGELTHAQAASVLGISEGTVSWRLSQARKKLRAIAREQYQ